MFEQLKTYLEFGNRFCGIEHTYTKGDDLLYVTLLKKNKKEVDLDGVFKANAIKEIAKVLAKKQHAFLTINNDNVLTKSIKDQQVEGLKLVYKAFPNIKMDDFYYEVIRQHSVHFVSICRKDYVEQLIAQYKAKDISIINISLGNSIAFSISDFIKTNIISSSNAKLTKVNNDVVSIEKEEHIDMVVYDVNGLNINNTQLLSFSGALTCVLHNYKNETNFEPQRQLLLTNYKQERFFNQFLKSSLFFLLSLLLINFFFFNHYFSAVNSLQQTSQINQTTKQTVLLLNKSVTKTQKLVDDMLKSSASKSSYYTNSIVQNLPNTILLSELNYQPLKKRIKAAQPIEIINNTLLISGASSNSTSFSKWITTLDTTNWISKTEILNYEDISKSTSKFKIKLHIVND